nr:hypothetical protein Cduv_75 [Cedratvirus duvanny]
MYASLKPSDLIFSTSELYEDLPENSLYGMVGNMGADRCPDWNSFVVVDHDKEKNIYSVVFPRVKMVDGVLQLGQDRLSPKELQRQTDIIRDSVNFCKCTQPLRGSSCLCVYCFDRHVHKIYTNTFEGVGEQGQYIIHTYHNLQSGPIFVEHTKVERLCDLDRPILICNKNDHPCLCTKMC